MFVSIFAALAAASFDLCRLQYGACSFPNPWMAGLTVAQILLFVAFYIATLLQSYKPSDLQTSGVYNAQQVAVFGSGLLPRRGSLLSLA